MNPPFHPQFNLSQARFNMIEQQIRPWEVLDQNVLTLLSTLRRGQARGEFRTVDVDAAVHSIIMPFVLLCVHKHTHGACGLISDLNADPTGFMRAHLGLILQGLQVRTGEPSRAA